MGKQTIEISVERYEELIKKEALYDQLAAEYKIEIYTSRKESYRNGC